MDRLFNVNNPLMRALSKLFDIGWLSLIYVVFCVPLVTIGAATTSLYSAKTEDMCGLSSGTALN